MSQREARQAAIRLHEKGESYREIAYVLYISAGKAHHLVAEAWKDRDEDAYEVARPPGRPGPPDPDLGGEFLIRLQLDFDRVARVVRNYDHRDTTDTIEAETVEELLSRVAKVREDSEATITHQLESPPNLRVDVRSELLVLEAAFAELLRRAVELDETLRLKVGEGQVLSFFRHDLAQLSRVLGCPLDEQAARWDEEDRQIDEVPEPSEEPGSPRPLTAADRKRRDERVVLARLGGASQKQIASSYGITTRHVRRIMESHRDGRLTAAPEALAALEEGMATIAHDIEIVNEAKSQARESDPKTFAALAIEHARLLDCQVALMRDGGLLSPEAFANVLDTGVAARSAKIDWVTESNVRLRRVLKEHGSDPETIDLVVDTLVDVSGLEEVGE